MTMGNDVWRARVERHDMFMDSIGKGLGKGGGLDIESSTANALQ